MNEAIKNLTDFLEAVFRYFIPGAFALALAYKTHGACWFGGLDWRSTNTLWFLSALAVRIGVTWHAFHRFTVHEIWMWQMYRRDWPSHAITDRQGGNWWNYCDKRARFLEVRFLKSNDKDGLRKLLNRYIALALMLANLSEIALLFALLDSPLGFGDPIWNIPRPVVGFLAVAGLLASLLQLSTVHGIQFYLREKWPAHDW